MAEFLVLSCDVKSVKVLNFLVTSKSFESNCWSSILLDMACFTSTEVGHPSRMSSRLPTYCVG